MRINNNIMAMNTHRQYGVNNNNVSKSVEKLSSGYRVNRAGDDAAGLAISEKMRAQIRGLNMASKNSQDAVSLVQTAEGALQSTHDILQRMRELATQSASDTNETTIDRDALNKEFQALIAEIDDTAAKTKFNDMGIIDGTFAGNGVTTTRFTGMPANLKGVSFDTSGVTGVKDGDTVSVTLAIVEDKPAEYAAGTKPAAVALGTLGSTAGAHGVTTVELEFTEMVVGKEEDFNEAAISDLKMGADNKISVKIGGATFTSAAIDVTDSAAFDSPIELTDGKGNKITLDFGGTYDKDQAAAFKTELGALSLAGKEIGDDGAVNETSAAVAGSLSVNGTAVTADANGDFVATTTEGLKINFGKVDLTKIKDTDFGATTGAASWTLTAKVIDGKDFVVQTGANQGDELSINIDSMDATSLKVKGVDITSQTSASAAITIVNDAINAVSSQRADLGALQNRLEFKISNLDTSAENLQSAESRIRDLDMAQEMTKFTKNNILSQAATAMLAQANSLPQGVLQLLR